MDKALRNAIIAGIIIITLSVGYYLVIFIPNKEEMRVEQQEREKGRLEQAMKECNDKAKEELKVMAEKKAIGSSAEALQFHDFTYKNCLREKGLED